MDDLGSYAKRICDFLAWKAANALGWTSLKSATGWRLGCHHNGYQLCTVVVYNLDRRNIRSFEQLRSTLGANILCPRTNDPMKILSSILTVSAASSIVVADKNGIYEILSKNPSLEKLLIEMDLNNFDLPKI